VSMMSSRIRPPGGTAYVRGQRDKQRIKPRE
jgi:hypothetical protein